MEKVVALGVTYYEVKIGKSSYLSFEPQELIIRMAQMGFSLN